MSQDAATDCSSASAGPEPRPRGRSSVFCMLDTLHRVTARPPSGRQTRGQPNAGGDSEVASSEPTREVLITFAGALVTVRPQSGHSTDTSTAPGSSPEASCFHDVVRLRLTAHQTLSGERALQVPQRNLRERSLRRRRFGLSLTYLVVTARRLTACFCRRSQTRVMPSHLFGQDIPAYLFGSLCVGFIHGSSPVAFASYCL